jgi:ribosome-associated heat shock protein Hsp15
MQSENGVRVDKYLWAVRIFKTRTIASDACKKGKVLIKGFNIKPSRTIKIDEIIEVVKNPITYRFRVKDLLTKRVGAKLVENFVEDITPKEELEKLEKDKTSFVKRKRGSGRPTKKERRDMDDLLW